jgi:carbamoyl-phosphate synthase large subunit
MNLTTSLVRNHRPLPYQTLSFDSDSLINLIANPTDRRWIAVGQAMQHENYTVDRLHELTKIDRWFLHKLKNIVDMAKSIEKVASLRSLKREHLERAKRLGFSDAQIAMALGVGGHSVSEHDVRAYRKSLGIIPWVKKQVSLTSLRDHLCLPVG